MAQEIAKALLVDDSKLSRRIQRRVLEDLGVPTVVEAGDGQSALDTLREEDYQVDLILTDWNMPVMDGLAFIRELRQIAAAKDIPVIVVSSEGEREKIMTALSSGANSYVTKPFRKDVLADKVKRAKHLTKLSQQERETTGASISGNLGMFGFAELVHFLNFAGKTGVLSVTIGDSTANVGFVNGEIHNAEFAAYEREQAFFEIAKVKQGDFQFVENRPIGDRDIHGSTISLLMEAMRIIDEEEAGV